MNQRIISQGLTVASAIFVFGGIASLVTNRQGVGIAVGTLGGAASSMVLLQTSQKRQQDLNNGLTQSIKQEIQALKPNEDISTNLDKDLDNINLKLTNLEMAIKKPSLTAEKEIQTNIQLLQDGLTETKVTLETLKQTIKNHQINLAALLGSNTDASHPVVRWLQDHEISTLYHHQPDSEMDYIFERTAVSIYKQNDLDFVKELRKSAIFNQKRILDLEYEDDYDRRRTLSLGNLLDQRGFIQDYTYDNIDITIEFRPPSDSDKKIFLKGKWFERYIHQKIIECLKNQNLQYSYLINPRILFQDGHHFEPSLLVLIEEKLLYFEYKLDKEDENYFDKYSENRKRLNLPLNQSIVIILECPNNKKDELTKSWNLTVIDEKIITDHIRKILLNKENKDIENPVKENDIWPPPDPLV